MKAKLTVIIMIVIVITMVAMGCTTSVRKSIILPTEPTVDWSTNN